MYRYHDVKIDADHDSIISLFESLCEIGPCSGYGCAQREQLIRTILHYTSSHFHREEMLMRAAGYLDLNEHLIAHAYMQNEFRKQLCSMPSIHPNLRADVWLLRQMFLSHILTHDDAFGQWLAYQRHASVRGKAKSQSLGMPAISWQAFPRLRRGFPKIPNWHEDYQGRPNGLKAMPRLDQVGNARR